MCAPLSRERVLMMVYSFILVPVVDSRYLRKLLGPAGKKKNPGLGSTVGSGEEGYLPLIL